MVFTPSSPRQTKRFFFRASLWFFVFVSYTLRHVKASIHVYSMSYILLYRHLGLLFLLFVSDKMKNLEVLFYVPNLIGYLRIGLCFLATYEYSYNKDSIMCLFYIVVSMVLDFFDGLLARALNQFFPFFLSCFFHGSPL